MSGVGPQYSRHELPDGGVARVLAWVPEGAPGTTVIVHHGIGEHGGRYQALADGLAPRAVVSFDLRGHGHSSGRRGDAAGLDGLVDDFLALFPALLARSGRARAVVYAHSMGGAVLARALTSRSLPPEIVGVVLSAPAVAVQTSRVMRIKARIGRIAKAVVPTRTLSTGLAVDGISSDPAEVQRYLDDALVHDRISLRLADSLLREGPLAVPLAARAKVPVLLVHGEADPIIPVAASRAFAAQGGAAIVTFPGGRHESHHEVPAIREALFAAVRGFVDAC